MPKQFTVGDIAYPAHQPQGEPVAPLLVLATRYCNQNRYLPSRLRLVPKK